MFRISTSGICLALLVLLALACHTYDSLSPDPESNLASPPGPDPSSTPTPDAPQVSIADPSYLLVPTVTLVPVPAPSSEDAREDHMIIGGLEAPTDMEFSPDQRLLVAEKMGRIRIIQNGALLPSPLLTIPVDSRDGRGLLGITLDPDFESNGRFYVYYTRAVVPPQNRVSRFTVSADDPNMADPGSELVILDNIPAAIRHNGGIMQFGPDGKLYVGAGDALSGSNAQSLATLAGKILRINPDGSVPADNPFVGDPNARGEIWAYGLRAPFRGDIDPVTGKFYVNDVGVQEFEEINQVMKGANYGWPACEGKCGNSSFTDPIYVYPHPSGCAVTGGVFYRGAQFSEEHQGGYFFGDLCAPWIKTLSADYEAADFAVNTAGGIVDLEVGPDGSLYYLSFVNGAAYRIQSAGGPAITR